MDDILRASVFASTIRLATPYIFASLGETFNQRSGVLNLGVDGIMLMGAFCGLYAGNESGSLVWAILVALIVGGLMGLLMGIISVTFKAEQGISGIGLYLFGLGMSEMLYQQTYNTPTDANPNFSRINFGVLSDIEFLGIGEIFFNHNLLVYIAFGMVPLCAYVLNHTAFGLNIRAVGQTPEAADAMGISVSRVRYMTLILGGMFSGLAGASLSLALIGNFQQNLTAGQGFIAVALVYFGGWRPAGILAGALLFSFVQALQLQIDTVGSDIPSEFTSMAPYVVTIIALVFASKRRDKPTALTKPFERGN